MACEVMLDRLRRIRDVLEECMKLYDELSVLQLFEVRNKCVERLGELGLLPEDARGILSDPYYDRECIKFVLKIIRRVFEGGRDE